MDQNDFKSSKKSNFDAVAAFKKKLTEDIAFELGKVTIGGDAVKVEDSPKEEEKEKNNGDK